MFDPITLRIPTIKYPNAVVIPSLYDNDEGLNGNHGGRQSGGTSSNSALNYGLTGVGVVVFMMFVLCFRSVILIARTN